MAHFYDHLSTVKKQTFDMAVITNSKGHKVGKIIIRYTDSQIGYNNETGIIFHDQAHPGQHLNFAETVKGSTYDVCDGVYKLLTSIGAMLYLHGDKAVYTYPNKSMRENTRSLDSMSRPTEFEYFKIGNRRFNILWV